MFPSLEYVLRTCVCSVHVECWSLTQRLSSLLLIYANKAVSLQFLLIVKQNFKALNKLCLLFL